MVRDVASHIDTSETSSRSFGDAARAFWKALAAG
jgi:hypothetical protein